LWGIATHYSRTSNEDYGVDTRKIFREAEAIAEQMRISRSRLYVAAISENLKRHRAIR